MFMILNGLFIERDKAHIMADSEGYNFGYSVFETIKIYKGKALFFEEHLKRLKNACDQLELSFPYSTDEVKKYCCDLIAANEMETGIVKILYGKNKNTTDMVISTRQNTYRKEIYDKGFSLCFAETKRNPHARLTYIKSANYLENILEKQSASKLGFDEVVFLNIFDKVSEGSLSNIFFVKDNILHTPIVSCGLLPGILREKVLFLGGRLGLKVNQGEFSQAELITADEVFITNSILGIMPVSQICDYKMDLSNNTITRKLSDVYYQLIENQ